MHLKTKSDKGYEKGILGSAIITFEKWKGWNRHVSTNKIHKIRKV